MKNIFAKKITQIAVSLALGCSLGAQAASLEQVTFGELANDIVVRDETASFVSFIDMLPARSMVADAHVEPFMGSEIDLVKYAFIYDALYDVEANFKNSNIDEYNKLRKKMIAKYGPGEEQTVFDKKTGLKTHKCVWQSDKKTMELAYSSNESYDFHDLYLNVFCVKMGEKI